MSEEFVKCECVSPLMKAQNGKIVVLPKSDAVKLAERHQVRILCASPLQIVPQAAPEKKEYKRPYCVYGFAYRHHSSGVRMLYKLCEELKKLGYEARLSVGTDNGLTGERPRPEEITVIPDVWLNDGKYGPRVCRWMLNYEGRFHRGRAPRDEETIFYWMKEADWKGRGQPLAFDHVNHNIFYSDKREKKIKIFYKGKNNGAYVDSVIRKTHVEMTRNNPKKHEEVGEWLRNASILYTYDHCTALIDEARLCGCAVYLAGKDPGEDKFKHRYPGEGFGLAKEEEDIPVALATVNQYRKKHLEYWGSHDGDLERFIRISQKL